MSEHRHEWHVKCMLYLAPMPAMQTSELCYLIRMELCGLQASVKNRLHVLPWWAWMCAYMPGYLDHGCRLCTVARPAKAPKQRTLLALHDAAARPLTTRTLHNTYMLMLYSYMEAVQRSPAPHHLPAAWPAQQSGQTTMLPVTVQTHHVPHRLRGLALYDKHSPQLLQ